MSEQITLGELIAELEKAKPDVSIYADFAHATILPEVDSYRGYYEQLAIEWEVEGFPHYVSEVLETLKNAMGRTFQGYKGGDFLMHEATPVWIANYGRSGGAMVVGVKRGDYAVYLLTETEF